MAQAIKTSYRGPTDRKGARLVATGDAGRIVISWDHGLNQHRNHVAAAAEYARRRGWAGTLHTGWIGNDAYHVWAEHDSATEVKS